MIERRWAKAEGYFTNIGTEFYGSGRHEYLLITYQDKAWQAMKILGDRNVPRGKVSFRTKKRDMKGNITELMDAEVQIRNDIEDENGLQTKPLITSFNGGTRKTNDNDNAKDSVSSVDRLAIKPYDDDSREAKQTLIQDHNNVKENLPEGITESEKASNVQSGSNDL